MQTVYIISSGSFYRPVRTPMGNRGWVGEINFWYSPAFDGEKIPNISKTFRTQEAADKFVSKELFKLFRKQQYRFRDYGARTVPRDISLDGADIF